MVDTKQARGKVDRNRGSESFCLIYITLSCSYPAVVEVVVFEPGEY